MYPCPSRNLGKRFKASSVYSPQSQFLICFCSCAGRYNNSSSVPPWSLRAYAWQGMRLVPPGSSSAGGGSALLSQRVLLPPEQLGCESRHLRGGRRLF